MRPFVIGILVTVVASAAACSRSLTCPVTVDDFCASASVPECADLSFENALIVWSASARTNTPGMTWGCGQCDQYDVLIEGNTDTRLSTTRYFARSNGALTAIVSHTGNGATDTCVAGPRNFNLPSCQPGGACGPGSFPDAAPGG